MNLHFESKKLYSFPHFGQLRLLQGDIGWNLWKSKNRTKCRMVPSVYRTIIQNFSKSFGNCKLNKNIDLTSKYFFGLFINLMTNIFFA